MRWRVCSLMSVSMSESYTLSTKTRIKTFSPKLQDFQNFLVSYTLSTKTRIKTWVAHLLHAGDVYHVGSYTLSTKTRIKTPLSIHQGYHYYL